MDYHALVEVDDLCGYEQIALFLGDIRLHDLAHIDPLPASELIPLHKHRLI